MILILLLLHGSGPQIRYIGPQIRYIPEWPYILFLFLLVVIYRIRIHYIYPSKTQAFIPPQTPEDNSRSILIQKAKDIAKNARVHLSGFPVGAAILSDTGKIYTGCNIEFDNYSNTIHAEEAAISAFVSAGEKHLVSIVVFTFGDTINFPCGMCLQSLFELGGQHLKVIACNNNTCKSKTIKQLLPEGFHL